MEGIWYLERGSLEVLKFEPLSVVDDVLSADISVDDSLRVGVRESPGQVSHDLYTWKHFYLYNLYFLGASYLWQNIVQEEASFKENNWFLIVNTWGGSDNIGVPLQALESVALRLD